MTIRLLGACLFGLLSLANLRAAVVPPDRPLELLVDHYLDLRLRQANVRPAAPADDATLLRRLTLDLNGRIPTPVELDQYLADTRPDKRRALVDRLMASPAFVRYQVLEFDNLLSGNLQASGGRSGNLREYLKTALTENRGWDRIFRELLLADESDPKNKGASEFVKARVKDLDRLTNDVSSIFFGVNISCAQCHDHPLVSDWKQDHFYGLKSFFARTVENGTFLAEREFGVVKYVPNKGKEKVAPIMFLTGKTLDVPGTAEPTKEQQQKDKERIEAAKKANKPAPPPAFSLRAELVHLALEPGQREFFARAVVNRVWYRLFGQGLVMPLDQMHSENPPSHPELLDGLARDFVAHGYDLRRLIRGLVLSQAYARDSRREGEPVSPALFAVARVRPLTPAQLATSLRQATTDPKSWIQQGTDLERRIAEMESAAGSLAARLAQPAENFQVGVGEALFFSNGDPFAKDLLADGQGRLVVRLKEIKEPEAQAELAVRTVLSRPARPDEINALAGYLRRRADRPVPALQQAVWALLATAEFRFNH